MRAVSLLAGASGLAAASLIGLAGTASAQGGCPSGGGWFLISTDAFVEELDNGNNADQNGDGLACANVNLGQSAKHDGTGSWTWKDNTN